MIDTGGLNSGKAGLRNSVAALVVGVHLAALVAQLGLKLVDRDEIEAVVDGVPTALGARAVKRQIVGVVGVHWPAPDPISS